MNVPAADGRIERCKERRPRWRRERIPSAHADQQNAHTEADTEHATFHSGGLGGSSLAVVSRIVSTYQSLRPSTCSTNSSLRSIRLSAIALLTPNGSFRPVTLPTS